MKIERISENQIRCTLSREELMERQIKLSELAYGSEKAKLLFQDMMQEASMIGFDAEDIPLMIEAIPVSSESLVLLVTKVEDPDELDTRFSRFTDTEEMDYDEDGEFEEFDFVQPDMVKDSKTLSFADREEKEEKPDMVCSFCFSKLEDIYHLSEQLLPEYQGKNTLYKDPKGGEYHLFVYKGAGTPEQFNRYCNVASEYGIMKKGRESTYEYIREHCRLMIEGDALQRISKIF